MTKEQLMEKVRSLEPLCQETARYLWNHPEVGGEEVQSSAYLRKVMEDNGFRIVNGSRLEHSFYAEYGSGKPVIGLLAEFDALPRLSQKVCETQAAVEEGAPGHGCSHNLIGSSCVTAAVALKQILEAEHRSGTIRFYGCPQEELLNGKTQMIKDHMFDTCDAALTWHPNFANKVHEHNFLANASVRFHFTGKAAHAGVAPERGRSALDAVELMDVGCNYLREHVIDKARIHYNVDCYGCPPNIVPPKASSWYFVRAPYMSDVKEIMERIFDVARGAALMTGTKVDIEVENGCCELMSSEAYADITYENMQAAQLPVYTNDELEFIHRMQKTFDANQIARLRRVLGESVNDIHRKVGGRYIGEKLTGTASSDAGDVSQIMPTNFFTVATWPFGCIAHTWQTTVFSGSTVGEKGALYAAQIMAGTAYDLLTNPQKLQTVTEAFQKSRNPDYEPMVK